MNKTQFKLILDSNITDSYIASPSIYNANYYVDLKSVITNDEDLDKSYYVYINFRSKATTITLGGIANTSIFLLNIDFNKGTKTSKFQSGSTPTNITNIIPITISQENGVATSPITYFDLKDRDQIPSIINNIRSINFIKLNVVTANSYQTFAPTTPDNTKYVCILSFVEV